MLVLNVKRGETVMVGVMAVKVLPKRRGDGNGVRLAFDGPESIQVVRRNAVVKSDAGNAGKV